MQSKPSRLHPYTLPWADVGAIVSGIKLGDAGSVRQGGTSAGRWACMQYIVSRVLTSEITVPDEVIHRNRSLLEHLQPDLGPVLAFHTSTGLMTVILSS